MTSILVFLHFYYVTCKNNFKKSFKKTQLIDIIFKGFRLIKQPCNLLYFILILSIYIPYVKQTLIQQPKLNQVKLKERNMI